MDGYYSIPINEKKKPASSLNAGRRPPWPSRPTSPETAVPLPRPPNSPGLAQIEREAQPDLLYTVYERCNVPRRERVKGMDCGAIANHGEPPSRGIKRINSKEKHWEGEEELTNPQPMATFNRNSPRFSNSPTRFHGLKLGLLMEKGVKGVATWCHTRFCKEQN
jgi:hypothetical protein